MENCEESALEPGKDFRSTNKAVYQWTEITDEFFGSVHELKLGELLHYELFGLFEAMSAIEMMDKKMDIGMVDGKEKIAPLTFEVAVQVCFEAENSYWIQLKFYF